MKGQSDEAVRAYFHMRRELTPAMQDGIKFHEHTAKYIDTFKRLPPDLPQLPLNNPITEQKIIVPFNELFDLSGVFDMYDETDLYEFKTGSSDSLVWAASLQIPFYFLIAQIKQIPIKRAYLIHFNQHNQTKDWCIIYNNKTAVNKAINLIESIGYEIHNFFTKQGLVASEQ